MSLPGVKTPNLTSTPVSDGILVNRAGTTFVQPTEQLATQLAGDGPIAAALTSVSDGYPLQLETWATLAAIPPKKVGQMAAVPTSDAGTHADPVTGLTVANSGTFRGSLAPLGWKRVGAYQDLSSKADQAALDEVVDQVDGVETVAGGFGRFKKHPGLTPADVGAPATDDPAYLWAVTDAFNKTVIGARKTGGLYNSAEAKPWPDVLHIKSISQSLPRGAESLPVISSGDNPWGGKSFSGDIYGLNTWLNSANSQSPASRADEKLVVGPMTAFLDAFEQGETPANAFAAGIKARVSSIFASSPQDRTLPFVFWSNACEGNRYLSEINAEDSSTNPANAGARGPGGYWKTGEDDEWRVYGWALANGLSYGVVTDFQQGEMEAGYHKLNAWEPARGYDSLHDGYRGKLIQTADDADALSIAVYQRPIRMPFLITQTADSIIGDAQLQASEMGTEMYMVGPVGELPSARNSVVGSGYGSSLHLSADAQRIAGEQRAKVLHRIVVEGERWTPLKRRTVRKIDSTTIDLALEVPRGPIVVETDFIAKALGWGFEIWSDTPDNRIAGTATRIIPSSIEVRPGDVLRLGLPSSIAAGSWYLRYGGVMECDLGAALIVASTRAGPSSGGQATTELVLDGDRDALLAPLYKEGAFNLIQGAVQMTVRKVSKEGGVSILQGENREISGGSIGAGGITASRFNVYGNIRDSDRALSVNSWSSQTYHKRSGRYELWNRLCYFDNLRIL
ncbi:UNVERIFIED_ORG: hypothetical protein LHK14_00535 [Roseateles sp. XES5]|nr:hypothetical protein [Roseateles sp. XES5]